MLSDPGFTEVMYGKIDLRERDLILPACGKTSKKPQRISERASGIRDSTLCGAMSTGGLSVFVSGLLEL